MADARNLLTPPARRLLEEEIEPYLANVVGPPEYREGDHLHIWLLEEVVRLRAALPGVPHTPRERQAAAEVAAITARAAVVDRIRDNVGKPKPVPLSDKLLPCPFCGGEAKFSRPDLDGKVIGLAVQCGVCYASSGADYGNSESRNDRLEAALRWNRRK